MNQESLQVIVQPDNQQQQQNQIQIVVNNQPQNNEIVIASNENIGSQQNIIQNNVSINDSSSDEESPENLQKQAVQMLNNINIKIIQLGLFSLIFLLYIKLNRSDSELLICLNIYGLLNIFYCFYQYKKVNIDRIQISVILTDWICLLCIFTINYFFFIDNNIYLNYLLYFLPIFHMFLWYQIVQNAKKNSQKVNSSMIVFRFTVMIQYLQVLLKLQSIVNTPWETIFWCNWLFFLISFLYLTGMIFLFLLTLFYYTKKESTSQQIIGLYFMLNLVFMVSFLSLYGVIGIIKYFEENSTIQLIESFYVIILWSNFKIIYIQCFKDDIIKFIISIQKENTDENEQQPDFSFKKQNIITRRKVQNNKFMVKQTSTFFVDTDITKELYLKMKQKGQKEMMKSFQLIESNKKKVSHENSFRAEKKYEKKSIQDDQNLIIIQQDVSKQNVTKMQDINDETIGQIKIEDQSIQQCLVCFELPPDSVIMDCGHGGLCYVCATDIWKKSNECYLCRQPINKVIQLDITHGYQNFRPILNIFQMQDNQDSISNNVSVLNASQLNFHNDYNDYD